MKIAALLTLMLLATVAGACPITGVRYVSPSYYTPSYYAPTVIVKEVVTPTVAVITAYPFVVPAYGSYYTPAPAYMPPAPVATAQITPAATSCDAKFDALMKRLDALERRGTVPDAVAAAPRAATAFDVSALFASRCASCHESAVAAQKGHGLVLHRNDGGEIRLTQAQIGKIVTEVVSGHMPMSGPPLAQAEKDGVVQWARGVKFEEPPGRPMAPASP